MSWKKRIARATRSVREALGRGPIIVREAVPQRYFYLGPELALTRLNSGPCCMSTRWTSMSAPM